MSQLSPNAVSDSVLILLVCWKHDRMCIERHTRDVHAGSGSEKKWVTFRAPIIRSSENGTESSNSYKSLVTDIVAQVLNLSPQQVEAWVTGEGADLLPQPALIHHLRVEVPQITRYATRYTYWIPISPESKLDSGQCCERERKETDSVRWVKLDDILDFKVENWLSPEVADYILQLTNPDAIVEGSVTSGSHAGSRGPEIVQPFLNEFSGNEDIPKMNCLSGPEFDVIKRIGMGIAEIKQLLSLFVDYTFPYSSYLTGSSLLKFLCDFWDQHGELSVDKIKIDVGKLYRAFHYHPTKDALVDFEEFLVGLCLMDQNTLHSGTAGGLRLQLIFRYYAAEPQAGMNVDEFRHMVLDLCTVQGTLEAIDPMGDQLKKVLPHDEDRELFRSGNRKISFEELLKSVTAKDESIKLRGTSDLLRSPRSIVTLLKGGKAPYINLTRQPHIGPCSRIYGRRPRGICLKHRQDRNKVISEFVVDVNVTYPWSVALSPGEKLSVIPPTGSELDVAIRDHQQEIVCNKNGLVYKVFTKLREEIPKLRMSNVRSLQNVDGKQPYPIPEADIEKVLSMAGEIFQSEERCMKVSGPVLVFGDLHESLRDLGNYVVNILLSFPFLTPFTLLFMGDYVDRGEQGIEVVLFLFCLKIMAPDRVFLLRGNHEVSQINSEYSFKKLCSQRFGHARAETVWRMFNDAFDRLPIAAVVDEAVFTSHGGIPMSVMKIEELQRIPCPLTKPQHQSDAAWQCMWDDPIGDYGFNEVKEKLDFEERSGRFPFWAQQRDRKSKDDESKLKASMYVDNINRRTGFMYNAKALDYFLAANGLKLTLRAHEVVAKGFQPECRGDGRCTTIFSSSDYVGRGNFAASVWIDDERLRVAQFRIPGTTDGSRSKWARS